MDKGYWVGGCRHVTVEIVNYGDVDRTETVTPACDFVSFTSRTFLTCGWSCVSCIA